MEGCNIEAATPDIENQYIELQNSLTKDLERLPPMTLSRCIHRAPCGLRDVRPKAYTPRAVSIGPLHHGNKALKVMEEHKLRYLQYFLDRSNLGLMHYIEKIKNREAKLRSCYSETIQIKSSAFVKIILVDSIFLIEYLFRNWYPEFLNGSDCLFFEPNMSDNVWLDFLMLENQLPLFILEELFDPDIFPIASNYSNRLEGVERLSIMFLSHYFLNGRSIYLGEEVAKERIYSSTRKADHLVDLLRRLYVAPVPVVKAEATTQPIANTAPSMERLDQAGVKFKVSPNNKLFDIRFNAKDGVLEIPKLKIVDSTEVILRNLVAYEQCLSRPDPYYISDYVVMMDKLVDTPKDVALLVEYGIVENWLGGGNKELSTMINSITTGVNISSGFYYGSLCADLNKYCSSTWHRRIANLRQNYFNTPWAIISFMAAVFLLLLTVIQTFCSIIVSL